jgi:hypothetical protein
MTNTTTYKIIKVTAKTVIIIPRISDPITCIFLPSRATKFADGFFLLLVLPSTNLQARTGFYEHAPAALYIVFREKNTR